MTFNRRYIESIGRIGYGSKSRVFRLVRDARLVMLYSARLHTQQLIYTYYRVCY